MGQHDWYRNTTWDKEIEAAFEARWNRSRSECSKIQYLRIQAGILLRSKKKKDQLVGVALMERLFAMFPASDMEVVFGREQLGEYYQSIGGKEQAMKLFATVAKETKKQGTRSGTSGIADLKLAELLFQDGKKKSLEEAYRIISTFPYDEISFNSAQFQFAELAALICEKLKNFDEAKQYAKMALDLAEIKEPQFRYHKDVGLVKATNKQLKYLKALLKNIES